MSYIIYHKETTYILRDSARLYAPPYATEGAAKAALTRAAKDAGLRLHLFAKRYNNDKPVTKEDFAIAETRTFHETIEKKEIRKGIIFSEGKDFEVGVNTPWTSGPWSETYHCS